MQLTNNIKGAICLVISGFFFALCNFLMQTKTFYQLNLPTSIVTLYQYLFAFIFLLPYLFKIGMVSSLKTPNIAWHIIRVIFAVLGVHFFVMALIKGVPINQVVGLITTSTIFVVIGSSIFLNEKVGSARWTASFIGCLGGIIILQPWSEHFTWYATLPLLASIFWAGYSIIVKKISATDSPITVIAYLFLLTTPFNLIKAYPDFSALSINQTALIFLLGLGLLTGLAQYFIALAYNLADASYIQPFDHIKIIINVVLAWLFLHQIPTVSFWVGIILVIGAVSLLTISDQKSK